MYLCNNELNQMLFSSMHKSFFLLFISSLLLGLLFLISCSRIVLEDNSQVLLDNSNANHFVTSNMVQATLEQNQISTKTGSSQSRYSVKPYVLNSTDTLMYIVQYENGGGWKILSSDTRVPPILAESESGRFSLEDGSPAISSWLRNMANDMAKVRASSDDELVFSKEEIENNKAVWRGPNRSMPPEYSDPYGHWEVTTAYVTEVCDTLDHMVAKWDQDSPYNELSPFYVNRPNERAAAGCVAIAGAQMLLFLHNALNTPSVMYSQGYCVGNTNNYYQSFSNLTSAVWSQMSTSYLPYSSSTLPEAILIGCVGQLVNMHYEETLTDYNSWAIPGNLKTDVFSHYGISCSSGSYNTEIVRNSLQNQMPVIVAASDQLIPVNGRIHCFVIDGYRITRRMYVLTKYWVLDVLPPPGYIMPDDDVSIMYSSPDVSSVKINWGWASQWGIDHLNDGWYSLTGGWTVDNGGIYDYNHNLYMIYGFSANN